MRELLRQIQQNSARPKTGLHTHLDLRSPVGSHLHPHPLRLNCGAPRETPGQLTHETLQTGP